MELITTSYNGMEFILKINSIMSKHKLSRMDLAKECGLSVRTIEGWFSGNKPSYQSVKMIDMLSKMKEDEEK